MKKLIYRARFSYKSDRNLRALIMPILFRPAVQLLLSVILIFALVFPCFALTLYSPSHSPQQLVEHCRENNNLMPFSTNGRSRLEGDGTWTPDGNSQRYSQANLLGGEIITSSELTSSGVCTLMPSSGAPGIVIPENLRLKLADFKGSVRLTIVINGQEYLVDGSSTFFPFPVSNAPFQDCNTAHILCDHIPNAITTMFNVRIEFNMVYIQGSDARNLDADYKKLAQYIRESKIFLAAQNWSANGLSKTSASSTSSKVSLQIKPTFPPSLAPIKCNIGVNVSPANISFGSIPASHASAGSIEKRIPFTVTLANITDDCQSETVEVRIKFNQADMAARSGILALPKTNGRYVSGFAIGILSDPASDNSILTNDQPVVYPIMTASQAQPQHQYAAILKWLSPNPTIGSFSSAAELYVTYK